MSGHFAENKRTWIGKKMPEPVFYGVSTSTQLLTRFC